MLLRNRVGKIGVDPDLLHVRDNEQWRVLKSVGVLLQLRIGLNQVAALALVFLGEAVPLPNIGKADGVADLPGRFLEGVFGAVPIYVGGLRYSEEGAQVEKMLLSGRPFSARNPSPSGNELFRRHFDQMQCARAGCQRLDRVIPAQSAWTHLRWLFDRDKKRDAVLKSGVVHHFVEVGWCRYRFAGVAHDPDVSGQRLERHILSFFERPTGGNAAGKVRKANSEIAVGILVNDRNVIHRTGSSVKFQIGLAFDGRQGADWDVSPRMGHGDHTRLQRVLEMMVTACARISFHPSLLSIRMISLLCIPGEGTYGWRSAQSCGNVLDWRGPTRRPGPWRTSCVTG